ncbi:MAG: hypothetical protein WBC29_03510 [Candidatus Moraniibacteriota bacterium]
MSEDIQKETSSEEGSEAPMSSNGKMASNGSRLFGSIAMVAIFGGALAWFLGRSNDKMLPDSSQKEPSDAKSSMMKADEGVSYTDGTYTALGEYTSPAGPEHITVTLTLKDGVITEVASTEESENPKSQYMQKQFSEGVSTAVTGKSIDSLDLAVVNGSSLTPKGFMDALEKIKAEAKG